MVACPLWWQMGPFLLTGNGAISVCLSYAGCFQVTEVQTTLALLEFYTKNLSHVSYNWLDIFVYFSFCLMTHQMFSPLL